MVCQHYSLFKDVTMAITLYSLLFTFFLVEYCSFERVHLYTYDLFAERIGIKLAWGCLVFYPFFYTIGVWPMVDSNKDINLMTAILTTITFFSGWVFTRGANLQKVGSEQEESVSAMLTCMAVCFQNRQ